MTWSEALEHAKALAIILGLLGFAIWLTWRFR